MWFDPSSKLEWWSSTRRSRREPRMAQSSVLNADLLAAPLAGDLEDSSDPRSFTRQTSFIQGRKVSLVVATLNVMNAIMGSGILALPSVMAENGLVQYICLQLIIMLIVDFSLHLLVRSSLARNVYSYEKLGIEAFGQRGRVLVSLTIIVQNTGAILSYMIVVGDLAPVLLSSFLPDAPDGERRALLMAIFVLGLSLPLACLPKLGLLGYSSFFCFCVMVNLCILTAVEHAKLCGASEDDGNGTSALGLLSWPQTSVLLADADAYADAGAATAAAPPSAPEAGGEICPAIELARPGLGIARALPTLCFSFVCHTAFLPVLDELTAADKIGRTRRPGWRVATVGHCAIFLAGCLYMWAAVFGYLTFGEHVKGDLWLSYTDVAPSDPYVTAIRTAFLLGIICTIPLIFFPMRKTVTMLFWGADAPFSWRRHLLLTFGIMPCYLGVAILVPSITKVFSVVGASSSVMLVFLLPSSIFLRCVPAQDSSRALRLVVKLLFVAGIGVAATAFTALALPE